LDFDSRLFEAIARNLEKKGASVRKGTLIDATVIEPVFAKLAAKGAPSKDHAMPC
jgi:hypothetical protein